MTAPPSRRTQAERRDTTIGRLLAATVTCLVERGYAATSTAAVCAEAGVSQGALFRHFPTRQALLVATAEYVAAAEVARFRDLVAEPVTDADDVTQMLGHLRSIIFSPSHQTWRELLVAARADAQLREAMVPARLALQQQMLTTAADLWGARLPEADRAPLLSIVVNFLDGLAFSSLDPASEATPGRTVEKALSLLAEMIVHRYTPPEES